MISVIYHNDSGTSEVFESRIQKPEVFRNGSFCQINFKDEDGRTRRFLITPEDLYAASRLEGKDKVEIELLYDHQIKDLEKFASVGQSADHQTLNL